MKNGSRKNIARLCVVTLFLATSMSPVQAAMLPATAATGSGVEQVSAREQVNAFVTREDVRSQFLSMGVEQHDVDARIAALSDSEVLALSAKIGTAPAGGDGALAVFGVIFIVMLVLELLGITNLFTSIGPAR